MLKTDIVKEGELKYEGFTIDILEELARRLDFNFTIHEADGYGGCKKNERTGNTECSGMVKDLVDDVSIYLHFEMMFGLKGVRI